MPANPERATRGGDVSGTTKTDGLWGVGAPIDVASASYEPGYDRFLGYASAADVKAGYCSYGVSIGEDSSLTAPLTKQMSRKSKV